MKYGKLYIKMEDGKAHEFNQSADGNIIKAEDWIARAYQLLNSSRMYTASAYGTPPIRSSSMIVRPTEQYRTSGQDISIRATSPSLPPVYVTDEQNYFTDDDIPF
jgi:hypothetical protein